MTSKLISKENKKKFYMTLIRTIVTYGGETWTLSVRDVNTLLIFERHIKKGIGQDSSG